MKYPSGSKAAADLSARGAAASKRSRKPKGVDPTTCQVEYSPDELEFLMAMDTYTRTTGRMFPTWKEALGVLRSLGYAKGWSILL